MTFPGAGSRHHHPPEELADVERLGHRDFVGGLWDQIGRLQLDFLTDQGLEPGHVLLDVGCGSLRGGVHFVHYLEPGHYLGLDRSEYLIQAGIAEELGREVVTERAPEFVVSDRFEFERFSRRPDFALAQSLFTHLTLADIGLCLESLRPFVGEGCRFYATFFEASEPTENAPRSHSRVNFHYTAGELAERGREAGWDPRYIGDWGHPRGQQMMVFRAANG